MIIFMGLIFPALAITCPGTKAPIHAGCQIELVFTNNCSDVRGEIANRIAGQFGKWHDPHNNGTYTVVKADETMIQLSRETGDKKFTDLMTFTFTTSADGCAVTACSQSQVFSIGDFGTNYCNLHDLYCNDAGCHPLSQLNYKETVGKCTEAQSSVCYKV